MTVYDRDGLKISAFLVNHDPVEPAYGYRIEYGGRAAVISGDTARVENMVRFSKGADVLVHESLNRDMVEMLAKALDASGNSRAGTMARQVIAYHTSPVEAAAIAKEAGVPLLVFTHEVPPLRNALMRKMFMRGVKEARGKARRSSAETGSSSRCQRAARTSTRSSFIRPFASKALGHPRITLRNKDVDGRDKPGHDDSWWLLQLCQTPAAG